MSIGDPYEWLEDIESDNVIKWVDSENERLRRLLGDLPSKLKERIKKYYMISHVSIVKVSENGYYTLVRESGSYRVKLITRDGEIKTMVDSRNLGRDVIISNIYTTVRGDKLAFTYSIGGSDVGFLRVIDPISGEIIDELKGCMYSITWIDSNKFYYVESFRKGYTPDGVKAPAYRVFLRDSGRSEMVFGDGLPTAYHISLFSSIDGSKALLTVGYGWSWCDAYAGDIRDPSSWRKIYGESRYISQPIDYINNAYYLAVYDDKRGFGRIIKIYNESIHEVIPPWSYPLRSAIISFNMLILHYLVNASSKLRLYNLNGEYIRDIEFKPTGTLSSFSRIKDEAVFRYESFYIPFRLYRLKDDKLEVISEESIDIAGQLEIKENWVKSYDNTPIHMFIIKKRDVGFDRILAYGYGGFSIGITPRYYPFVIPFLEDDGVLVIANIRGGDEYGEEWHKAGMRENKQNVFEDFKAVLRYFRAMNARIAAMGASNGGLLIGAVLTQNPELLDCAIIGYPVLDMLKFHKLYIGRMWVPEYGDPDNPKDREFLLKYSPYHNIKPGVKYPPTLVYTGLHDDRVHPSHAFKFVAKLRDLNAPVYLRTEKMSGHLGASPDVKLNEYADILAFIYKHIVYDQA